jgi:aspartate aminotransferase
MKQLARLSSRAHRVPPSATSAATEAARSLAARGVSVVALTEGEPDALTPEPIRQAAYAAVEAGYTKYPPVQGYPDLREAIVAELRKRGAAYLADGVVVSCGAKPAILNALLAIVEDGDDVIVPTPAWVSYSAQVTLVGGRAVEVQTCARDGFILDPERLEAAVTPRTVAMFVNSPCNPTGAVYTREQLQAIADVAMRHGLWIISDEIYAAIVYGVEAPSLPSLGDDIAQRTVLIDGASKTFAMTGWRLGWSVCEPELARAIVAMQGQTTSGAPAMSQRAALAALGMDRAPIDAIIRAYARRREYVLERLARIPGITCTKPYGAFYVFPDISLLLGKRAGGVLIDSSQTFARELLAQQGLGVVAGEAFSAPGYLRISFAAAEEQLLQGLDRLERFVGLLR